MSFAISSRQIKENKHVLAVEHEYIMHPHLLVG